MKKNCDLILLIILLYVKAILLTHHASGDEEKKELIGNPFIHDKCSNAKLYVRFNGVEDNGEIDIAGHYNGSIELHLDRIYDFDNASVLKCDRNPSKMTTKLNVLPRITTRSSDHVMKQMEPSEVYNYERGSAKDFECKRSRGPKPGLLDSLHWILVKDANKAMLLSENYNNVSLNCSKELQEADNNTRLICLYFECDKEGNTVRCKREVTRHILLYLASNSSSVGFRIDDELPQNPSAGSGKLVIAFIITAVGVIILTLVALGIWQYRRIAQKQDDQKNSKVEYIEIEFSSDSQPARPPVKKDEIIYSKVKGILRPAENTIPDP